MAESALRLRKVETGVYRTQDGTYQVSSGWAVTFCDPHPGHQFGNEEHAVKVWIIEQRTKSGDYSEVPWTDTFDTKREAVETLAAHLKEKTNG